MRRPLAAVDEPLLAPPRRDARERALGRADAEPRGLVVDGLRVDAGALEPLVDGLLPLLLAQPQEVRPKDGGTDLLLATATNDGSERLTERTSKDPG